MDGKPRVSAGGARGKLAGAARHLFHQSTAGQQPDMAAKAAALNIQGYVPPKVEEQDYRIRSDCWAAVEMFTRILNQPQNGPIGAVSLEWLFRLYEVKEPRQMMEDLRIMEHAWLDEIEKAAH